MEVTKEYLKSVAERARSQIERVKEERKEEISKVKLIVEVGLGSFAIGWYHGRKGAMPTYFGVPMDAGAGGLLILTGFFKFSGSEDIFHVGLGVFSYWTGNLGAQLGQKMRKQTPDWKGTPFTTDANGNALGADGKPYSPNLQVRTITAGNMRGMPYGAAPAYAHGANAWPNY